MSNKTPPIVNTALTQKLKARFQEGFSLIQVILGPRQVGKTTAILNLIKNFKKPHLYVSCDNKIANHADWLNEVWQNALTQSESCYLFIDEIQKIENWSEVIKSLWDKQKIKNTNIKLILLGSSSLKIQKGLTESLTGRFELISAYHWTYKESQLLQKFNLEEFLKFGGYPESYKYIQSPQRFKNYINNSIIATVIEKDILTMFDIRKPALFKQTVQMLSSLPAAEISYTKMLGQLQDKGNTELIKNYIEILEGAFLFAQIYKYNAKTLNIRSSSPKIIPMCPSLSHFSSKSNKDFIGLCFEALVGSDLVKLDLEVYYWRNGDFEIDYVVLYNNTLIGIEVKSGKRKSSKSVPKFKETFPDATVIYINFENYKTFSENPIRFLEKLI